MSQSYIKYHIAPCSRWRNQVETFSALLALCAGNSPVTGEFPSQRPLTRNCDIFCDLCLNKRLSKQSWGWWFELRRHRAHYYAIVMLIPSNYSTQRRFIFRWTITYKIDWKLELTFRSFIKVHLKVSAKIRPFCLDLIFLNVFCIVQNFAPQINTTPSEKREK